MIERVLKCSCRVAGVLTMMIVFPGCSTAKSRIQVVDAAGAPVQGVEEWCRALIHVGPEPKSSRSGRIGLARVPTMLQKEGYLPALVTDDDLEKGVVVMRKPERPLSLEEDLDYRHRILSEMLE